MLLPLFLELWTSLRVARSERHIYRCLARLERRIDLRFVRAEREVPPDAVRPNGSGPLPLPFFFFFVLGPAG